ncbi:MAG: hypothetical protein DSZ06_01190 [Sulfurospirillum sp.]|nr:MAG: hypothetical protein DSZ06_01190 [Sulfurospirillum sp.]
MKKILLLTILITLLQTHLFSMSKKTTPSKIDDWEYNSTKIFNQKFTKSIMPMAMNSAPMLKSIGFSVGGAKDANNFYENIKRGYLPKLKSITYEGVFYDHYFQTDSSNECKTLFCPDYESAIDNNPYNDSKEYWLSIKLGSNLKNLERKRLNIVVVMDISGSMSSAFDEYYYDQKLKKRVKNSDTHQPKMVIANNSITAMLDHLKDQDRLGVVLFDNSAYLAKPLRDVAFTDMDAIKRHILDIKPKGGTNWSAGYKKGVGLFDNIEERLKDPNLYENRIIFITDAMPNRGELSKNGLLGIAKEASKRGIFTTFIGVGVDFNNDLVEAVSKTKGANYYSIHSSKEFKKRLDSEFDYMVTPLIFNLKMRLLSENFKIDTVYGSANDNSNDGTIFKIYTLFPSPTSDKKTKGGVILVKLKKIGKKDDFKLKIEYEDRKSNRFEIIRSGKISKSGYETTNIQKAILLARYVDLMQNFLLDSLKSCNNSISTPYYILHQDVVPIKKRDISQIDSWERRSCKLEVSTGYLKLFELFKNYFKSNMDIINDSSLSKEFELLNYLTNRSNKKIDDWNIEKNMLQN